MLMKYVFLFGTLLFTIYSQIIIKARWRVIDETGAASSDYLLRMLTDLPVLSGFVAAGLAALCWLMAIRYFEVAYAYPFMALSFVFVPALGWALFGETLNWQQFAGLALIICGVTIHALSR